MRIQILEQNPEERLDERFNSLKTMLTEWSKETLAIARPLTRLDDSESIKLSLNLVRTIVSKWSIEILAVLRKKKPLGFVELRKSLKGISSRVLSGKLKTLENNGLIEREILNMYPPRVRYTLTAEGRSLTSLGAPVVLYLRFSRKMPSIPRKARKNHRWLAEKQIVQPPTH